MLLFASMSHIPRIYDCVLKRHIEHERQMAFVSGPRQVGKTTVCSVFQNEYFNWDKSSDRNIIIQGEDAVASKAGVDMLRTEKPVVTFDEIHHYPHWKRFLKGFFDAYGARLKILVTGSARLDIYKRGGDSLMGRYFPYRVHPFSIGELLHPEPGEGEISPPAKPDDGIWHGLLEFGGFPEPLVRGERAFSLKWRRLRFEQLVRQDIRTDTAVKELGQIEAMANILADRSGEQLVYASLGREVQASEITAKNWVSTLSAFHFGFRVRPWSHKVENAIRKTPKWYLRDWSGIADAGKRNETFVACHLLKAVEFWTDTGQGEYGLYYIRDKQKAESDFLVAKDGKPWFLVEVKTKDARISPALKSYKEKLGVRHAFQVVMDMPFVEADCFAPDGAVAVPARTFLSQLP